MRAVWTLVVACAVIAALPSSASAEPPPTVVVHTTGGDVEGVVRGPAAEWRGIPFAAPPVGDLRWRSPEPPEPWVGTRTATEFAPQCPQLVSDSEVEGSEDCLYLNVFAPVGTNPSDELPVMVHLYPGGNFFGRSYRNADPFVERGVMVVTVGYRIGVMGFVGHPELSEEAGGSSGEYGVLDQIAALKWVQENIAAFGGDPENVTLFGESAGAFDAVAIAASPLGRGLFQRLAAQTVGFGPLRAIGDVHEEEDRGLAVAAAVGCSEAADVLGCLRATPTEDLVVAAGPSDVYPLTGGQVLPAPPLDLIRSGVNPMPMLLGSLREEAAFWYAQGGFLPPGDQYEPVDRVRDMNALVGPQNGVAVRNLYPVDVYGSPFWASIAAVSDAAYTCAARSLALANDDAPVYRYLYTHRYETVPDPVITAAGAAHFFDEPILWQNPDLLRIDFVLSSNEEVLAGRMADYWTNFAKTGDPNGDDLDPWAPFTAESENIKILDEPVDDMVGYHNGECQFFEQLPGLGMPAVAYTPGAIHPSP
jgi:para-nitrobenzyl esterase